MTNFTWVLLIGLIFSQQVNADIFKYTAANGRIFYTDQPKHRGYKRIIRTKPANYAVAFKHLAKNKKKFTPIINKVAVQHQVDAKLLHAVIQTESAYDANAVSSAGAVGLMQLMPTTARRYGVLNRRDPGQNIAGGARYLKDLLKMFNSNLKLAVAAYNAGENAVKKYHNAVPPYPETRNYVKQVLALYQQ